MFSKRKLVVSTKREKDKVIAPLFEKELGVKHLTPKNFDTVSLGPFTGEIVNKDDPIVTPKNKYLKAIELTNCDLGIASEGSFGSHPYIPFIHAADKFLIFIDKKNKLEIIERDLSTQTNLAETEIKQRPLFNPVIVHIKSVAQLDELAKGVPPKAKLLAETFFPGSFTLALKKQPQVSNLVTGGRDTVAIRMPNHQTTLALLKKINFPLATPSANPFGCISPTSALHVESYFLNKIPLVLDGGNCKTELNLQ